MFIILTLSPCTHLNNALFFLTSSALATPAGVVVAISQTLLSANDVRLLLAGTAVAVFFFAALFSFIILLKYRLLRAALDFRFIILRLSLSDSSLSVSSSSSSSFSSSVGSPSSLSSSSRNVGLYNGSLFSTSTAFSNASSVTSLLLTSLVKNLASAHDRSFNLAVIASLRRSLAMAACTKCLKCVSCSVSSIPVDAAAAAAADVLAPPPLQLLFIILS